MVKAIDIIANNPDLQTHWFKRLIAIIIDLIIVIIAWWIISIPFAIGSFLFFGSFGLGRFGIFFWILWLLYTVVLEGARDATIGKSIVNLRVQVFDGRMDFVKALIRNISKIHGLLLILDWIVGMVIDGDPRQRFLDRISNTVVVRTDYEERFPPGPAGSPYYNRPVPNPPRPHPRTQAYRR